MRRETHYVSPEIPSLQKLAGAHARVWQADDKVGQAGRSTCMSGVCVLVDPDPKEKAVYKALACIASIGALACSFEKYRCL
jgi:hypothetical protein